MIYCESSIHDRSLLDTIHHVTNAGHCGASLREKYIAILVMLRSALCRSNL